MSPLRASELFPVPAEVCVRSGIIPDALSSDSDISDFINNLESQDIKVELMKHRDYMSEAPHSAAINVTGSNKVSRVLLREPLCWISCSNCWFAASSQDFKYVVAFNSTNVHSLPMAVNILSNALLRGLNGSGHIRTWTKPFEYVSTRSDLSRVPSRSLSLEVTDHPVLSQQIPDATSYALVYIEAIMLGMLAAGMPAYFAMDHTRDREVTRV